MSIDNHVVVNISKETSAPSQVGFGVPAILSLEAAVLSAFSSVRVKSYSISTVLAELVADGFTSASQTYLAAAAHVSQSPRPETIKVIRRAVSVAQVDTNTIDTIANATTYTVTINAIPYSFLSDADATDAEIQAGLVASINGGSDDITAAPVSTDQYSITSDVAGKGFSNSVDANQSIVLDTPNVGPATELALAQEEDNDFYFVELDVNATADAKILSAYIETQIKLFSYATDDANSKGQAIGVDTTSLMKLLSDKNYDRTFGLWVPTADLAEHKNSAWVGKQAPKDPGSTNWAYKTANGITPDVFTSSEAKNVADKNGNTYTTVAGQDVFFDGKMSSGEYIDITRGIDWITARIKEAVFGLFTSTEKVPYDDGGIESVGLKVQEILTEAEKRLILVSGSSAVTVPLRDDTEVADRAARIIRDIKFTGELAGAINKAIIDGSLSI